jgi:hypothetical protein
MVPAQEWYHQSKSLIAFHSFPFPFFCCHPFESENGANVFLAFLGRFARWVLFKRKKTILVNFVGP